MAYDVSKQYENERAKCKVTCKCGHIISFEPASRTNKVICNNCGYYVYRSEREKFKELLNLKRKRLANDS